MISVFPKRERFPVGWSAHAAKNKRCSCSEKFTAAVFPFGFGADDTHAVCAKGKNRKGRGIVEARLAGKALDKWFKMRIPTNSLCERCHNMEVPKTRMVGADVSCVFQRHKPLPKYVWTNMKRIGNSFLHFIGKAVVIECDNAKRYDFHHSPYWRVVGNSVFSCKMLYLWIVGCFVSRIGNPRKKSCVLCLREFRHVCRIGVRERVCNEIGVASCYYCTNGYLNSRKGIHCHQAEVAIKHVDAPYGFKRCVWAVCVGIGHPERMKVSGKPVIANRFKNSEKCYWIGNKPSTLKQGNKIDIAFRRFGICFHHDSNKKKIPVATIGRSLSGGVTGGIVPYLPLRCNGAMGILFPRRLAGDKSPLFFARQSISETGDIPGCRESPFFKGPAGSVPIRSCNGVRRWSIYDIAKHENLSWESAERRYYRHLARIHAIFGVSQVG